MRCSSSIRGSGCSLGGAAFLTFSRASSRACVGRVFFALATALIVANTTLVLSNAAELVPVPSAVLWVVGVAALVAARWRLRAAPPAALERAAQVGSGHGRPSTSSRCWLPARRHATRCAPRPPRKGSRPRTSWSRPRPADPFRGDVVVMTRDEYYVGRFHWLGDAASLVLDGERVPRPRGPVYEAAARDPLAQRFLVWARYPAIDVEAAPGGGTLVRFYGRPLSRRRSALRARRASSPTRARSARN